MESLLNELCGFWCDRGAKPRRHEIAVYAERMDALFGEGEGARRLEDACLDYAGEVERQAFEMGFACAFSLLGELSRRLNGISRP
ncbi:MAG: hypothetical protein Q4C72_05725 [Eubacteriales bacterium]|nr:hypothetical protein [Eubacteriales bacterium]